jgi:hypothetical protein
MPRLWVLSRPVHFGIFCGCSLGAVTAHALPTIMFCQAGRLRACNTAFVLYAERSRNSSHASMDIVKRKSMNRPPPEKVEQVNVRVCLFLTRLPSAGAWEEFSLLFTVYHHEIGLSLSGDMVLWRVKQSTSWTVPPTPHLLSFALTIPAVLNRASKHPDGRFPRSRHRDRGWHSMSPGLEGHVHGASAARYAATRTVPRRDPVAG